MLKISHLERYTYVLLEIPASQVFLGADAQLHWTSLAGSRMPLSISNQDLN